MRAIYFSYIMMILIFWLSSCSEQPEICDRFDSWKIFSENEEDQFCSYQQIYLYQDEYYSLCVCCHCDKIPMAVDCNGNQLCDSTDDCMDRFYRKAEYVFSAIEEN